jgi:hypothetical protein
MYSRAPRLFHFESRLSGLKVTKNARTRTRDDLVNSTFRIHIVPRFSPALLPELAGSLDNKAL